MDLTDVIQMIIDCVSVELHKREEKRYPVEIDPEVLEKAMANTVKIKGRSLENQKENS
ncbi:MAG: hypothetical protein LBF15_07250 [Candidatus Peribacteria bacterium]|nr:hypothetical protein [Candidatus Peribacteria bacterium]